MKRSIGKTVVASTIVTLAAEVISSAAIWHGTPADWTGPFPHFWLVEAWRLKYWAILVLPCTALFGAGWTVVNRTSARLALGALALVCLLGSDYWCSVTFWRSLPWDQAAYLGWPDLQHYTREHSICWSVAIAICGGVYYLRSRVRGRVVKPSPPGV